MFKTVRGRLVTILAIVLASGWLLYSHKRDTGDWLKLGLDLQGGMHLALEVDDPEGTMTAEAKADMIDRVERIIRTRIDEFGVQEPLIQKEGDQRLIVELAGVTDQDQAKSIITRNAFLEFKLVEPIADMEAALPRMDRAIVATLGVDSIRALTKGTEQEGQSIEDILFRNDSTAADSTAAGGRDSTQAADSAASAAAALSPLSSLLSYGDTDGTFLVAAEDVPLVQQFLAMPEVQRAMPRDQALQWGSDVVSRGVRNYKELYVLTAKPFLTGDRLEDATAERDPQFNQSIVRFQLSRAGGRDFERFSGANVGRLLAIVLDGEVMSAPGDPRPNRGTRPDRDGAGHAAGGGA